MLDKDWKKIFLTLFLTTQLISAIALIFNALFENIINFYIPIWLIYFINILLFLIVFYCYQDEWEKKIKALSCYPKLECIAKYIFLFGLLSITANQLLPNLEFAAEFYNKYFFWLNYIKNHLIILTILFGGFVFWMNRDKVEIDLEKEKKQEETDEKNRAKIFDKKYNKWKPRKLNFSSLKNVIFSVLYFPFFIIHYLFFKFVKWMYKEGWKYSIALIAIIILGFILRFLGAIWGNINLDEGIHLYDAKLITEGFVPFRDYFTREPYYIYLLSFFVKIFGTDLLVSRLLSVIASTLTIPIIYLLGKNIFSQKIGFIATIIFSLSPFVIYNTYLGNLYGVYPFVLSLVFLSFFYLLKDTNKKNVLVSGFLLGLAVHFYRLTIFYFPIIGFIWAIVIYKKYRFQFFPLFCLSVALPFFPPLIYFSYQTGYHNFEIIYGTNELIIAYFSIPFGLILGIIFNKLWRKYSAKKQIIVFVLLLLLFGFFIYSFLNIGIIKQYKAKILFDAFLQSWHLIFLILVVLIIYLKKTLFNNSKLSFILKIFFLGTIIYLAYYGTIVAQNLQNFGARIVPIHLKNLFFVIFILSIIFLFFLTKKINFKSLNFRKNIIYWWFLFFAPIVFYLVHVQIFASNFMSYIVLGSIIAALGFWFLFKIHQNSNYVIKISLIIIFIQLVYTPIYLYTKFPLRGRMWPQEAIKEIKNYIEQNTNENEEIFTMANVFVLEAHRKSALNLSRVSIYSVNPVYMPNYIGVSKNLIPSKDLAIYIKNNVNLILIDNRVKQIFLTNDDFKNIQKYYYLDKKWSQYEIEAWKKK